MRDLLDIFSLTDGIPRYYYNLIARTGKHIEHSRNFLDHLHDHENTSKKNYKSVPSNATVRSEHIRCGKSNCLRCPHGPYYYAYWKDGNGKLNKKYIGSNYNPSWKRKLKSCSKGKISHKEFVEEVFSSHQQEYMEKNVEM